MTLKTPKKCKNINLGAVGKLENKKRKILKKSSHTSTVPSTKRVPLPFLLK